jgi:hypothetical protein
LAFFDAGAGRKLRETTGDHLADSFVIMKETLKEHAEGRFEEVEVPRDGDRSLQETLRMVVAFDGCLFEANVQAQFGDFRENGILSLLTAHNDLIVRNTIFQGNLFGDESTEVSTSLRLLVQMARCANGSFTKLPFFVAV